MAEDRHLRVELTVLASERGRELGEELPGLLQELASVHGSHRSVATDNGVGEKGIVAGS